MVEGHCPPDGPLPKLESPERATARALQGVAVAGLDAYSDQALLS